MTELRLMCVFPHPDDETLGMGSTLAKYAAEGIATYLVTATRGERCWTDDPAAYPGPQALGEIRTAELHAAAQVLGIHEVASLDYIDGDLDQADPAEVIGQIVAHIRRVRPQVIVTFGPDGAYGHPDHIALSQFTSAAIVCAADPSYVDPQTQPEHRVAKLYYMVDTKADAEAFLSVIGDIIFPVDGVNRGLVAWNEWAVTTRIDATDHWRTMLRAADCHASQLPGYQNFEVLKQEQYKTLWGIRSFYRAFSTVNGGRRLEHDFFEGLRSA
jgi:LmbE family N-acetylglucosaminyl deacetylase